MRSTTAGENTILAAAVGAYALRVEIKNSGGTWIAYDSIGGVDWQDRAEITMDANQRVAQATVWIAREADGNSLSPLITADIDAGRAVRISGSRVAPGSAASYKQLFLGVIDSWDVAADPMQLVARDDMGKLVDRWVEDETSYGTTEGRAIESVMQDILNGWTGAAFTLYVPSSPGFLIKPYRQQKEAVLSALQALADLIGWVLEYRWDDGTSAFRLTFYEPDRTPSGVAWTFGPNDYYDVTKCAVSRLEIRNAITVRYTDSATGERSAYTTDVTDTVPAASIAKYGRLWMEIEESDDSPIDSDAEAQALHDAALSDLATPIAEQAIGTDFFWPIQLGDFYGFLANDVHYDSDQEFAVTGYTHVFENGTGKTTLDTRGAGAVSHTRGWIKREAKPRPEPEVVKSIEILNFREISRTSTTVKYGWTLGSDLKYSWIHDYTVAQPYSSDNWPADTRHPDSISTDRDVEYTVSIPEAGNVRYLQVEGRRADGSLGDTERVLIFPSNVPGDYIAFAACTVNQTDGSATITGWSTDRAQSLAYAYNVGAAGSTSAPTEAMAEAQGTGASGGGLVTGFTSDFTISLPASTLAYGQVIKILLIAYINVNGTGPDGTSTDHDTPVGCQGERFKISDPNQIDDGIVISKKLRDGAQQFNTNVVFSATDWDTVAWTSGTLLLAGGSSYSIASGNTGNLSSSAPRYIYFDKNTSTTVLQVTTAYGSAVGEDAIIIAVVQRASSSNGEAFFVPAIGILGINGDVIGQNSITTTHITDDAVTTPKLVANAVTAAKIAAGTITANEIAANTITAAKLNVASLSAITADCGTITAGTISTSVLIASSSFTAVTAAFTGTVEIKGASAAWRLQATTTGLNQTPILNFRDTAGSPNTAYVCLGAGNDGILYVAATNGVNVGDLSGKVGFYGTGPSAKLTVTGSRGGNAALASLCSQLAALGLITDSTS